MLSLTTCEIAILLVNLLSSKGIIAKHLHRSYTHTCDLWNIYRNVFLYYNSGQPGGKLAWYINGLLVPELTLTRGERYTFEVYGGSNDGSTMDGYHPFYITDSPTGGRLNNPRQVSRYIIDQ